MAGNDGRSCDVVDDGIDVVVVGRTVTGNSENVGKDARIIYRSSND